MAAKVTSLERYRTLADKASHRLKALGIDNVSVELKDGSTGQKSKVFDRIVVNLSYAKRPKFIANQLAANGIALVPIGPSDGPQIMTKITKRNEEVEAEQLFPVRMQPPLKGISKAI